MGISIPGKTVFMLDTGGGGREQMNQKCGNCFEQEMMKQDVSSSCQTEAFHHGNDQIKSKIFLLPITHTLQLWVLSAPNKPHVGPMDLAIRDAFITSNQSAVICRRIKNLGISDPVTLLASIYSWCKPLVQFWLFSNYTHMNKLQEHSFWKSLRSVDHLV